MRTRLVIDGNNVYEIDEECMDCRRKQENAYTGDQEGAKRRKRERPDEAFRNR